MDLFEFITHRKLQSSIDALSSDLQKVKRMVFRLQQPAMPIITLTGERIEMLKHYLDYTVAVGPIPAIVDAVKETLVVTVGGNEVVNVELGPTGGEATFSAVFEEDGVILSDEARTVAVTVAYVDKTGNQSQAPLVMPFVVVDTLSPPTPDANVVNVTCTGERIVDEPTPE